MEDQKTRVKLTSARPRPAAIVIALKVLFHGAINRFSPVVSIPSPPLDL